MNICWQHNSLYLSFEHPKLKADLLKIKSLTPKYEILLHHLESKKQPMLTYKADSNSQEGLTLMNKVQEATNSLTEYIVRFKIWLPKYDFIADLATHSLIIDTHLFYLKEQQESTKHKWLNKIHYYYASRNFYNLPYASGLLFATVLYAQYLKRGDAFLSEYNKLLRATGKMSIESICNTVDIDPTSKEFWRQSLDFIKKDIDLFESLIEKSYPQ